jgi:hypothetical protein
MGLPAGGNQRVDDGGRWVGFSITIGMTRWG